ncbi:hypothetical protein [Robertkochia solimangrovi]|uniref:hypothetical protein n=1 Tax=Robertkochia solimangrovi TaxID=2213046 RepID=UPI00117F877B|nr:hypothetical protein [Robertkochia solimangrovi]TRZ45789.1 hypothetical protein DMZ48_00480 [Robertkochia solimangrovi]
MKTLMTLRKNGVETGCRNSVHKEQSNSYLQLVAGILIMMMFMMISCSKDEVYPNYTAPAAPAPSEIDPVELAQIPTDVYQDYGFATQAGYQLVPSDSNFSEGVELYIKADIVDDDFQISEPEGLIYQNEDGQRSLIGVAYRLSDEIDGKPGNPPVGFAGAGDKWRYEPVSKTWMLNVYVNVGDLGGKFALIY